MSTLESRLSLVPDVISTKLHRRKRHPPACPNGNPPVLWPHHIVGVHLSTTFASVWMCPYAAGWGPLGRCNTMTVSTSVNTNSAPE